MNHQNFQILADTIRANQSHFDLSTWFSAKDSHLERYELKRGTELEICGTTACLCGWINFITVNEYQSCGESFINWGDENHAADWLGISYYQSYHLFTPDESVLDGYITFWSEAFDAGIITNTNPYNVPVDEVADMLEGFAKGDLKLS